LIRTFPAAAAIAAVLLAQAAAAQTLVPMPENNPGFETPAATDAKPGSTPGIRVFSPEAISNLLKHQAEDPPPKAAAPADANGIAPNPA
jgi:hypothetical protein